MGQHPTLLPRAHEPIRRQVGTGAPEARRESSTIAEKNEHCAGHYPGGGAGKRQLASFTWWLSRRRIWAAFKSFGFEI
jgi:hypothetical protein